MVKKNKKNNWNRSAGKSNKADGIASIAEQAAEELAIPLDQAGQVGQVHQDSQEFIDSGIEDDDLASLLSGPEEEEEEYSIPQSIRITKGALAKANAFARLAKKVGGRGYEWYGFPLGMKDSDDDLIVDIFLARNQRVSGSDVEIEGADVISAAEEFMPKGYKALGWTHCHGDHHTFHSGTDDENIYTVLNTVSLETRKQYHSKIGVFSGGIETRIQGNNGDLRLTRMGNKKTDGMVEYQLQDEEKIRQLLEDAGIEVKDNAKELGYSLLKGLLENANMDIKQARLIGTACSIVVNAANERPYTELAYLEEDIITGERRQYKKVVPLEIIEVENDLTFTDESLISEIKEKIQFPAPRREKIWKDKDKGKKEKKTGWRSKILPASWPSWFGFDYSLEYPDEESDKEAADENCTVSAVSEGTSSHHELYEKATSARDGRKKAEEEPIRQEDLTDLIAQETAMESSDPRACRITSKKDVKKEVKKELKDITDEFVLEFMEYASSMKGKYSGWADTVLYKILGKETSLADAFKEELKENEEGYSIKTDRKFIDCIACNFYHQLDAKDDKDLVKFMDYFIRDKEAPESRIEEYIKALTEGKGYKPYDLEEEKKAVIKGMASMFGDYAFSSKGQDSLMYGNWARKFNNIFVKDGDFNEALRWAGAPDDSIEYRPSNVTNTILEVSFEDAVENDPSLIGLFKGFLAAKEEKGLIQGMIEIAESLKGYRDILAASGDWDAGTIKEEKEGNVQEGKKEDKPREGIDPISDNLLLDKIENDNAEREKDLLARISSAGLDMKSYRDMLSDFGKELTDYSAGFYRYGANRKYLHWVRDVINTMADNKVGLIDAIASLPLGGKDVAGVYKQIPGYAKEKAVQRRISEDHESYPLVFIEFMEDFVYNKQKEDVISKYLPRLYQCAEGVVENKFDKDAQELIAKSGMSTKKNDRQKGKGE